MISFYIILGWWYMSLEGNVSLYRRFVLPFTCSTNCRVKEANLVRLADCLLSAILRQCTTWPSTASMHWHWKWMTWAVTFLAYTAFHPHIAQLGHTTEVIYKLCVCHTLLCKWKKSAMSECSTEMDHSISLKEITVLTTAVGYLCGCITVVGINIIFSC
jgi:hypothetical protein